MDEERSDGGGGFSFNPFVTVLLSTPLSPAPVVGSALVGFHGSLHV